jgi:hypothetical protein
VETSAQKKVVIEKGSTARVDYRDLIDRKPRRMQRIRGTGFCVLLAGQLDPNSIPP